MRSKRYRACAEKVKPDKYSVGEAVKVLKSLKATKFDETLEVAMKLNVDPKKSDQMIRGTLSLPNGIGKQKKVIVIADGDEAAQAKAAGADEVGTEELAKKIQDGWDDFDVAIATPRCMKFVSKLGKVLGPKGKMPSQKSGTLTAEVTQAVKEFKAGKIEFRTDAAGNVQAPIGKLSFEESKIVENFTTYFEHVKAMRPSTVKGHFILSCTLKSTMSPGLKLDLAPC
jgi:large subunit ribosomal protein L1